MYINLLFLSIFSIVLKFPGTKQLRTVTRCKKEMCKHIEIDMVMFCAGCFFNTMYIDVVEHGTCKETYMYSKVIHVRVFEMFPQRLFTRKQNLTRTEILPKIIFYIPIEFRAEFYTK